MKKQIDLVKSDRNGSTVLVVNGYGKGKCVGRVGYGDEEKAIRIEFEDGEVRDFAPAKLEARGFTIVEE